jgi:hypothetical protein
MVAILALTEDQADQEVVPDMTPEQLELQEPVLLARDLEVGINLYFTEITRIQLVAVAVAVDLEQMLQLIIYPEMAE